MILEIVKREVLKKSLRLSIDVSTILLFSLLIALASQFELILPFSPVPITLQTLAVMATGLILGRIKGSFAVLAYITEGALGLPFFAGGSSGIKHILGPTGGYLLGFVLCAYFCGYLKEKGFVDSYLKLFSGLILASIPIFFFGLLQLSFFIPNGMVFKVGFYPFILGDILKITLLSLTFPLLRSIRKRKR